MTAPEDDRFRDAYAAFTRRHDEQRQATMASLPNSPPAKHKARFRSMIAAAAIVAIVGLGFALFFSSRPAAAYGIEGLRERLLALRSLYLKGWLFQRDSSKSGDSVLRLPVELYFERPTRYYTENYAFVLDEKDRVTQVTHTSTVNDGQQAMAIMHNEKQAFLAKAEPLEAELTVEYELQMKEINQLFGEQFDNFELVGSEWINQDWCDIYRSVPKSKSENVYRRIWIKTANGLPARVLVTTHRKDVEDEPVCEFNEIRANVAAPAQLFSFKPPKGYKLTEIKETPNTHEVLPFWTASWNKGEAATWIAIRVDNRAVLVCWSRSAKVNEKQTWFPGVTQFTLSGNRDRACTEQVLYETVSGETRWRWSLIVPNDRAPVAFDSLKIDFLPSNTSTLMQPLVLSGGRLPEMVVAVQRRSLEASGNFNLIKALDELRAMIAKRPPVNHQTSTHAKGSHAQIVTARVGQTCCLPW
jgi:outer membrane lipoprotein-sorting protein